jgi:hypothetical protein
MKCARVVLMVALSISPMAAGAQQYQAPPSQQRPATPPSWSYDPYTSGIGPCAQKSPLDIQTYSQIMPPTYGQPNYRSR